MTQYVKLSPEEQLFGAKGLLEAQAGILTSMQHLENYRRLREEELKMKILIKKIMGEAKENLSALNKLLPEPPAPKKSRKKEQEVEEKSVEENNETRVPKRTKVIRMTKEPEENISPIEQELEEIRRKISRLS